MRNTKIWSLYLIINILFITLIIFILRVGKGLESGIEEVVSTSTEGSFHLNLDGIIHHMQGGFAILLMQIIAIIITARILGWLCTKISQPKVIGEILAGIILGPSLLGYYFPDFSQWLFPQGSFGNLQVISQIGLVLFMFVVGMELDLNVIKKQAKEALVISHSSIVIPFALGLILALFLYKGFAPDKVPFISFALFIGISMSITAFPVLARIVQERGIYKTKIGALVITCAAADDITAWSLLAVVIAVVKAGSLAGAIPTVGLALVYVLIMLKVIRPFFKRIGELYSTKERLSQNIVSIFFLALIISSFLTEVIGIHALFGAFMAGAIMPENKNFKSSFIEKIEDVSLILFLPLFFVFTGLRTKVGLLNDISLWEVLALVIFVAVSGKLLGSAVAAKFVGLSWKESLSIGALMNTRGLVELVALNIGYDLGVLSPEIFTILVIMALLTTFMTAPVLSLIERLFRKRETPTIKDGILISFSKPETSRVLLKLAVLLAPNRSRITALHVTSASIINKYKMEDYERSSFEEISNEALSLNIPLKKAYNTSEDILTEIANFANRGAFKLLLIGIGNSKYTGTILGNVLEYSSQIISPENLIHLKKPEHIPFDILSETIQSLLNKVKITTAIYFGSPNISPTSIVIYLDSADDYPLLDYGFRCSVSNQSAIHVTSLNANIFSEDSFKNYLSQLSSNFKTSAQIVNLNSNLPNTLDESILTFISISNWTGIRKTKDITFYFKNILLFQLNNE